MVKEMGEWKLIRASAFWGLLARMASALGSKLSVQPWKIMLYITEIDR